MENQSLKGNTFHKGKAGVSWKVSWFGFVLFLTGIPKHGCFVGGACSCKTTAHTSLPPGWVAVAQSFCCDTPRPEATGESAFSYPTRPSRALTAQLGALILSQCRDKLETCVHFLLCFDARS